MALNEKEVPRVRKVVFPAAGLGTRFLPMTKSLPKEMLNLVDTPVLQYALEEAVRSGIAEAVVITSRGKGLLEDHFDRAPELESVLEARGKHRELESVRHPAELARLAFVRQPEALGLGHAVLTARPFVGNEPFAVVLCDDVISADPPCLRQLLDIHEATGASVIAVEAVDPAETSSYGIVAAERLPSGLLRINDLVEKPDPSEAPSNLAIVGRYVLTASVFDHLERTGRGRGGEIQLTDGLKQLLADEPIYACPFRGTRYDAGSKLGYLRATVEIALGREDLGDAFRTWLKSLSL